MTLTLYSHPFSSYCQKVLIALRERDVPFAYRHLEHEGAGEERAALWPFGKFPVLRDGAVTVGETSIIIEYCDQHYDGGGAMIPADRAEALEVRYLDRMFDLHVMEEMTKPVVAAIRGDATACEAAMAEAARTLEIAYGWIEQRLRGRTWAAGESFTMADCAAAPSLFYADWVHPIAERHAWLRDYRARLLARPSVARAVEEARPYRHYFPLGAPDRD